MSTASANFTAEAFKLLNARTFFQLQEAYTREDQRLMKAREWDPDNPDLVTNKVKKLLILIDPRELSDEDRGWWNEILWFWYHHATSCTKSRADAQRYSAKALEHMSNPTNPYTRLLWHLAHDRVEEAKKWMAECREDVDPVDYEGGMEEIGAYVEGRVRWVG